MPPWIATNAPKIPTPAYTRLLTNLVQGFVSEEKKIALREHFSSLPLISANCSLTAVSREKVFTTFWLPIISSISEVCSPLVSDCCLNME